MAAIEHSGGQCPPYTNSLEEKVSTPFVLQRLTMFTIGLILTVIFAGSARAADAPLGKLVIVKAIYGDPESDTAIDVTNKVTAMVADNSLSVVAGPELGNPIGAVKKLKVSYTIDGLYRSKTVASGETLDISTRLIIRKAVYGKLPGGPTEDVTDQLADMIRKNSLSVKASNDLFGDPARNVVKQLQVDYTLDGVNYSKTVSENQTLTIPEKPKK